MLKKSIKTFFNDYNETQKVCNVFYKKHWKGQIVLTLAATLMAFAGMEVSARWLDKKDKRVQEKHS